MSVFDLAKPYLMLAATAFVIGFVGYLAAAPRDFGETRAPWTAATISAPASSGWNFQKAV